MSHAPEVCLNAPENRFEAHADGKVVGTLVYEMDDDVMALVSTEVDPDYGGRGIGGALVQFAFEEARESGDTRIRPVCPFAVAWARKHPEYADLVTD